MLELCVKRKYWFKAKNYGWGWYPASWQGWTVLVVFAGILIYRAVKVEAMFDTTTSVVWRYMFESFLIIIPLLVICYLTGEKPEWRWGKKKK